MARYLTPAKVALLSLIELYTEDIEASGETLPVLTFVTARVLDMGTGHSPASDPATRWTKAEDIIKFVTSTDDFKKLLDKPGLLGRSGKRLWDQFIERLWAINSLNSLHEFFEERLDCLILGSGPARSNAEAAGTQALGESIKLTWDSPWGCFVRRARLEFHRLSFSHCTELWKDFVEYRQPTAEAARCLIPNFDSLSYDSVLQAGKQEDWNSEETGVLAAVTYGNLLAESSEARTCLSTDDVEYLLEFQVEQMQKFGDRVPIGMKTRFQEIISNSFLVPSLKHYLKFLEAWRSGDQTTAFDYLHRYFDYTIQHRDRSFYQYALMNLAVLQADFGCHQEAVSAMLETVSTARENQDMICLNFALNWLFHFARARPNLAHDLQSNNLLGSGKESLSYLRARAKESGMWTLWSSVLLSEAKLALVNGESVVTAFECMVRSSHIIVEKNVKSMFGTQFMLYSALWNRLGVASYSRLLSDSFLTCYAQDAVFDDILRHTCRIAMMLAENGSYDEGLERLKKIDKNSLRSWKPRQYWIKYVAIIKLKRYLNHNYLDGAEELLAQLLQSRTDDLEPDLAFVINSLYIDYLTRRGDLKAAFAHADAQLTKAQEDNTDILIRVRLQLIKVSLLDKCGRPQRAFPLAVQAANTAWRARLLSCLWPAIGAISRVLVSQGEFPAAESLMVAVIPRAHQCESCSMTAQLYTTLADAHMGRAGEAKAGSDERKEQLLNAKRAVQKAFDQYALVENIVAQCEMTAKKACILKLLGEPKLAMECATAYVELTDKAEALRLGDEE